MQRCLSSKSLQTINTQSLPTGVGRVHPSCNCSSTASTLFWSSIDFIIINYGCDLTLLNNNDNEARILSTQWSNQFELISCVRNVATYNNFFQEVIRADSSAGSFSQLGTYNSELRTCVVISVPPRSLRGCHGGSQSKPHHLFAMLLQAVQWPFVDERRITGPNV